MHSKLIVWSMAMLYAPPVVADEPAHIKLVTASDHIDFLIGSDLVGRYECGPKVAKPYLWPVNGPGGRTMTRGWPMEKSKAGGSVDHPWQKSVWFCHGDVIPEGLPIKHKAK